MDSAEKKKMLRVLIAGAGIAGPALAFWLSRLGHTCTIVERSSELRSHGQQIDIRMQGLEAVERMGLLEDVRKIVVDQPAVQFVDAQGKCCAKFPGFDQGFVTETEVMRGDLCNLLVEKTKDTTEYRFGLSVVSFQNKKDGVTVTFSDDTSDTYDMLVAADGQGSRIRRSLLLEDEPDCARSLGVNIAFFTISRQPGDSNIASVYVAPGKRAMVTRFHSATHGQGYFFSMSRTEELKKSQRMDVALQKELWASIFRGGQKRFKTITKCLLPMVAYKPPFSQMPAGSQTDWSPKCFARTTSTHNRLRRSGPRRGPRAGSCAWAIPAIARPPSLVWAPVWPWWVHTFSLAKYPSHQTDWTWPFPHTRGYCGRSLKGRSEYLPGFQA